MDSAAITIEIQEIRNRLKAIDEDRQRLAADAFMQRIELLDEEHLLEARLGELRDQAAQSSQGEAGQEAARRTDLTHSPGLPTQ
jgi:hypothetical protein